MKEPKTSLWIVFLALAFSLGVTILDLLPSLSAVPWHGLFVIPVVWIALWSAEDDVFLLTAMAIIVTALALLPVLSSLESTESFSIGKRVVVLVTIWLTVFIALLRKRAQRTFKWINLAGRR